MKYVLHQVLIHVLSECNLACKHCYAHNFKDKLSLKEIKKIMDDSKILGASLCHFSGGEFFLREDYQDIVNYAHKLFPYVEITSNGQLIDLDICNFLKNKISKLIISFEGPNAQVNDKIRGKGSFNKAKKAILIARKNKLNVGINFTITKQNIDLINEMIKFAKELNINFVNFRRFIPVGAGKEYMELSPQEYLNLNRIVNKARRKDSSIAMAGDPTRILLDSTLRFKTKFAGCMAGIALISINPNGDITPCGYLDYCIGNIRKNSLIDIWNNSRILFKLRDRENLNESCKNCSNKLLCGGCRAAAYAKSGNLFSKDPLCWLK
ncbi:MAG: radical SAM protein [Nanoarchaeota archaeon]|nr:radical SAM protein [Nanoarchaeota archaeon]